MGGATSLAGLFQSARPGASTDGEAVALEARLTQVCAQARAAWPAVHLSDERFVAHLAARLGDTALESLHASDLFLACACADGDPAALDAFQRLHLADLRRHLARLDPGGQLTDEVRQTLAERLLVGAAGSLPKIADYSGAGPLGAWVRVAAVRTALTLRRQQRPGASDSELRERALPDADLEVQYLQSRYRPDFEAAFADGLAALPRDQRNLLRLHFLDGLNIDKIGLLRGVHRATAARWINAAQSALLEATRDRLRERLKLDGDELDSLIALVRSRLEISVRQLLARSQG